MYLERQAPLEGTQNPAHLDPAELDRAVQVAMTGVDAQVDWETARATFRQMSGVPVRIGARNFPRAPAEATPAPAIAQASGSN
jgi:hypothetical protein